MACRVAAIGGIMAVVPPVPGSLLNAPQANYTKYEDQLMEQYKVYVDSSQKLSDRRLSTNNYLLTINSSLLPLLGLLGTLLDDRRPLVMIPVAGFLVSAAWFLLLLSFKRLNAAKFDVIQDLEKHLSANVFDDEWRRLTTGNRRPYRSMSDLERMVPVIFLIAYALLICFVLNWPAGKEAKVQRIEIQKPVQIKIKNPPSTRQQAPAPPAATPAPNHAKKQ